MNDHKRYINNQPSAESAQAKKFDPNDPELSEHFSNTYRSHYNRLCAYAYQFVNDHSAAEDIVQNSFLSLWERRQKIDFSYEITNLLYTVVRRASSNYLNKRKDLPVAQESLAELAKENLVNEMVYSETLGEIYQLAQHLPAKCNEIFKRLFVQGKDHAEVARELNITESTIRTQKARALSFLRLHLHRISGFLSFFI